MQQGVLPDLISFEAFRSVQNFNRFYSSKEMDSVRLKKAKIRAEGEAEQGGDRLSNLPEVLILHILSLMDTKFAVQTCLLSTRWKSLWTSLPNLTFNSKHFRKLSSFDKFVCKVLLRRSDLGVCDFYFTRGGSTSPGLLQKVAKYVKSHGVQRLSIDVASTGGSANLSHVFNSKSLEHFRLTAFNRFRSQVSLNLPALTTLHLEKVPFSEYFSTKLFSECLNLRNLALVDCNTWGSGDFNIFTPQLAYLTVSQEHYHNIYGPHHWEHYSSKFVVSAPKLTSLSLNGFPPLQWYSQSLPSLEKVQIDTFGPYIIGYATIEFKQAIVFQFINVLRELRNAKSVTLTRNAITILSMFPGLLEHQPSPFSNLKSLKLKWKQSTTSIELDHVMTYLLNCSPGVDVVTE